MSFLTTLASDVSDDLHDVVLAAVPAVYIFSSSAWTTALFMLLLRCIRRANRYLGAPLAQQPRHGGRDWRDTYLD